MEIYTIGLAGKSAARFFGSLKEANIARLIDVRLRNRSQLAGFARAQDLPYFLGELSGAEYAHEPLLAPTKDLLDSYRKKQVDWPHYERAFLDLMAQRQIETAIDRARFEKRSILLCSENGPERCHRRLVVEYLQQHWTDLKVFHV